MQKQVWYCAKGFGRHASFPPRRIIDKLFLFFSDCSHDAIKTFESLRHDVFVELVKADEVKGIEWKRFPMMYVPLTCFHES